MSAATVTDAAPSTEDWLAGNQRALMAEVAALGAVLRGEDVPSSDRAEGHSALDAVCGAYGLSGFERSVLLACAAPDLDATFGDLLSSMQGYPERRTPTFGLCLAALPGAHWSALLPGAPLRYWQLIELGAGPLTAAPLHVDEWVLHVLTGAFGLDQRLAPLVTSLDEPTAPSSVAHHAAGELANAWSHPLSNAPVLLRGQADATARGIVIEACQRLNWQPYRLQAVDLPVAATEQDTLARLWQRTAALHAAALLVECPDGADPGIRAAINRFVDRLATPTAVTVTDGATVGTRAALSIDTVAVRPPYEQRQIWQAALGVDAGGTAALHGALDRVIDQFDMNPQAIATAAARALNQCTTDPQADLGQALWSACRTTTRGGLDQLAARLPSTATFADLVLPEAQHALLGDIIAHVRHRTLVYHDWEMSGPSQRGLGVAVLFSGPSGTGKTLAAEALANTLELDLYRIDLSQVVSKYIGETEKNLRRVFDAAAGSGAVLLFDEADALFGKRSEVRDSHDRYANVEISYLLQAMETYRGLAVLTTNMSRALDTAFLRRLRFVVTFPFPGPAERAQIWARAFPAATPTAGLDIAKLSQLSIAGGNIRSIALHAAFAAADAGVPVGMAEVLRAAVAEYAKLERPLTDAEIGGWL